MFTITGPHHWIARGVTPEGKMLTWSRETRDEALAQINTVIDTGECDHALMFIRPGRGGTLWTVIQGVSRKQSACLIGQNGGPVTFRITASTLWINRPPVDVASLFNVVLADQAGGLVTRGRSMMRSIGAKAELLARWSGGYAIEPEEIKSPIGRIEVTDPRPAGTILTYDDAIDTSRPHCIFDTPQVGGFRIGR